MNFELLKKENILHDYEQVRLRNKRRLQERQEEIYAKIPEIKKLQSENTLLLEENRKLNDTISWMHDTIWHLISTRHTDRDC